MNKDKNQILVNELYETLDKLLMKKWYPLVIDNKNGGYYTNLTYDMKLMKNQEKMIVTQARHMWATAKASAFFPEQDYKNYSLHGFDFMKNKMWDDLYGGFYQIRGEEGNLSEIEGWMDEKRTYGNAFAIYGLSALYEITKKPEVLELAIETFKWLDNHAYDRVFNGYFQFLTRAGVPFYKNSVYQTKASDSIEAGYKDQNSSIHMLEAYTELYRVWPNSRLRMQLTDLVLLIRNLILEEEGYLRLFFERNWNPVSFKDSPSHVREENYRLDHVSFGHDYETAFLLLEASFALKLELDTETILAAKKMIDHAIENGWDKINGGFFDEGYYFDNKCEIIKDTKNWWAQAEALNALLLFSRIFPEEKKYYELFLKEWDYVKKYLIDYENGDWYWGSLEKEPFYKTEPKGSIWKGTYHNGRALMNCIIMLSEMDNPLIKNNEHLRNLKIESEFFINYWRLTYEKCLK